jgi:hypothetical protein
MQRAALVDGFRPSMTLRAEPGRSISVPESALKSRYSRNRRMRRIAESPGGFLPPGAPRSVREPLDSYGSRVAFRGTALLRPWAFGSGPFMPM